MSLKSFLKVSILFSTIMSSLCYFYIIPGELGKSIGKMKFKDNEPRKQNASIYSDHEGFCFYNDTQTLIKRGAIALPGNCEEISCGDDYTLTVAG